MACLSLELRGERDFQVQSVRAKVIDGRRPKKGGGSVSSPARQGRGIHGRLRKTRPSIANLLVTWNHLSACTLAYP